MALPVACINALKQAEKAIGQIPGFSALVLELDALLAAAIESEGFALIAELTAIYKLAKAIAAKASVFSTAGAAALNFAGDCVKAYLTQLTGGGRNVACSNTHKVSTNAQGPGVCCAAYAAAFPGQTPAVGQRVVATNRSGKCIVCEVTTSRSTKHPGMFVFKRGKASVPGSTISCPSTAEGCCALLGQ